MQASLHDQEARLASSHHPQQGRSCGMALLYPSTISNNYHPMVEGNHCLPKLCSPENWYKAKASSEQSHFHSYTSTAVKSVIGVTSQVVFPTKVFSLAGVRDGGVRVGSYTHEGVRIKAKTLAHVRAARSMVDRSLLTCLSSLYDVHPNLVPGIGRYRTTMHLIRRDGCIDHWGYQPRSRARSFILLPYMHEDVRGEGGSTCM